MKLTLNQTEAVQSIDRSVAIIAGAGSGKTEVLTQRLVRILKSGNAGLSQILAITFTEKSAGEMKRRIASHLDPEMKKELPWASIGTFHSFCLNLLKEHGPLVGLSNFLSVWEDHTAKLAIHHHCRREILKGLRDKNEEALLLVEALEFRNTLALLEELMAFRWHWEKIKKREKEEPLTEAVKMFYGRIAKNYGEEKRRRQVVDFQDLEIEALKLLKENKTIRNQYQSRFAHILVDEAQDINDLQRELIELLFDPQKNILCIVGDPKQSIYRFRGANVEGFETMVASILKAEGRRIALNENFRSRPEVLEKINHLFSGLFDPGTHAPLTAMREGGESPGVILLPVEAGPSATIEERRKIEATRIAGFICSEAAGEKSFGDFTLLFQSLSEVSHYEEAFKEAEIPCRIFGGRGFFGAQEVLDCLFILKIMAGPEDRLALAGLMRSPFLGLPDTQITEMCLAKKVGGLAEALFELKEAEWLKKLWLERENLSGAEILEQAVFQTEYDSFLHRLDPSGNRLSNIEQLIQTVRELETSEAMGLPELLDYFETLRRRQVPFAQAPAVDTELSSACQMMTVHAAKGLQFPVVILPDLLRSQPKKTEPALFVRNAGLGFKPKENSDGSFEKLKERENYEDLKERRRLLYVAMTRAREKIILPIHPDYPRKGLWHEWINTLR